MKHKALIAYLIFVAILSGGFVVAMKFLGEMGNYLAGIYMFIPAISAVITRLFFYENKFKDANLKFGKLKQYIKFWAIALGITVLSYIIFTFLGSISWNFSGEIFLSRLSYQMAITGQNINDLPAGLTPQIMLFLYFIGGLTIFNILPGLITGFGEEFGWRGFMFPLLYKIKPWVAFIVGGLIWYSWHWPLALILPQVNNFTALQYIINFVVLGVGSICTFAFLAYVYVKTENIFVTSVTHVTFNNSAAAFSYFVIVENQMLANVGLMITMLIVIGVLYYSKELKVFKDYFQKINS
ncbi:CPBP family intramembrane glutamic endopeptidase [Patescibacteria group bacterium]